MIRLVLFILWATDPTWQNYQFRYSQDATSWTYYWQLRTTFPLCMQGPDVPTLPGCYDRFSMDDQDVDLYDWSTYLEKCND